MFLAVSRVFRGIMGCSRGVPGLFRAVPGCSGGVPGMFRGVLGVFRAVPGCSGFYRHPSLSAALTKHQLIVKFTELSVDLLITLGERYLLFVLFRKTRIQPLLCLYFQY